MPRQSNPATDAREAAPQTGKIRRLHLPQKLRNLELFLLIIACGINLGAVVLVQLGALGQIDTTLVLLGASLSGLVFALHIMLRFVAREADPFILPIATLLNGIGIAMIYRIDIANNEAGWSSAAVRQTVWSGLAIACAITVILVIRNHRVLFRYTYVAGCGPAAAAARAGPGP